MQTRNNDDVPKIPPQGVHAAISSISIKTPQKAPPFQPFRFVPLCSARNLFAAHFIPVPEPVRCSPFTFSSPLFTFVYLLKVFQPPIVRCGMPLQFRLARSGHALTR
jgi:hypothetical protein